jgi:aminopeptidase N
MISTAALICKDEDTVSKLREMFQKWMESGQTVPPNIRSLVYNVGIRHGGIKEWRYCWEKYKNTTVASEKSLLLGALGSTQDTWLLKELLNYALDQSKIRSQDATTVIDRIAGNSRGGPLVWKWARENWNTILSLFREGNFKMGNIISSVLAPLNTQSEYEEAIRFFAGVDVASGKQALYQSLERIRGRIFFKENLEAKVIEWLDKNFVNKKPDNRTSRSAIQPIKTEYLPIPSIDSEYV